MFQLGEQSHCNHSFVNKILSQTAQVNNLNEISKGDKYSTLTEC